MMVPPGGASGKHPVALVPAPTRKSGVEAEIERVWRGICGILAKCPCSRRRARRSHITIGTPGPIKAGARLPLVRHPVHAAAVDEATARRG